MQMSSKLRDGAYKAFHTNEIQSFFYDFYKYYTISELNHCVIAKKMFEQTTRLIHVF